MNENPKSNRITLALPDGTIVRVQGHKTDDSKVAIKADSDDILDNFAMMAGVDLGGEKLKGASYAILIADKEATAIGVANFVRAMISEASTPTTLIDPTDDEPDADADADDDDSGEGDAEDDDADDNG